MKKYLSILTLFLFVFISCDNESDDPSAFLPEASGQHGEILLIMDDNLWDGIIGEAVVENLSQFADGPYLRPEPVFNYYRTKPKELDHLNQLNRNLLKFMIDTDSTYEETAVIELKNYYAKNQLFVVVKDSDPDRLLDFTKNKMDRIITVFNEFELSQLIRIYKKEPHRRIKEIVEKQYGITISLPKRSEINFEGDNFLLVKRDRSKNLLSNDATKAEGGTFWIQEGFMFWNTPFVADSQLTVNSILQDRDSVLKYNVPGKLKDTYMGTEYSEYYEPEGRVFDFNGHKAVEILGLWKYEGKTFIGGGGPFVHYAILNESRNEIVTVSAYVYGPKYDKREYIRELMAIMNTIVVNP